MRPIILAAREAHGTIILAAREAHGTIILAAREAHGTIILAARGMINHLLCWWRSDPGVSCCHTRYSTQVGRAFPRCQLAEPCRLQETSKASRFYNRNVLEGQSGIVCRPGSLS